MGANTVTLSDLLTRLSDLKPQDDGVLAHCPAHADSEQSLRFTVSDTGKVLVRCRAGCATPAIMAKLGLTMRDLATMEPGDVSFERATSRDVPASVEQTAALAARLDRYAEALYQGAVLTDSEAYDARGYAQARFGVGELDAERLGLGYAEDLGGGPRLVVPFRDPDGVPHGFQARSLEPDAAVRWLGPKSPEGASWSKIGWLPGSTGWEEVLVTEGPGDGLTAAAVGYDTILVAGAANASNPTVLDQIHEWTRGRVVVVAGDGDPAGRGFSAALAKGILDRGGRAKILELPDGMDLAKWQESKPDTFPQEFVQAVGQATEQSDTTATLAARDTRRYPLTDLGNARYVRDFVAGRGSGVRFSPEAGFFLLDGGVWRPDKLDGVRALAQEAADTIAVIAARLRANAGSDSERVKEAEAWARWSKYSQSMQGINAALRELQALPDAAADVNDFDRHPHLLAVLNGVVDLRTGELGPHDPALLMTRRVAFEYDPAARAPRWEQFLREVFPNHPDTMPAYIRRLTGYGITGSTAEQCFAVLWGKGSNGKSLFTDTLTEVFRELTVTTPFSTFEKRPSGGIPNDLAALKGSRLVMTSEGEQGEHMAEAVIKRVTGRDLIAARFMRKEFFEFRPTFLLWMASNFKPNFKGQDEGLWRRVKLIPWERYFAPHERDYTLADKLLSEAEGILAWAVRGAVEWYAGGLEDPAEVREATKEYRETSDGLAGFLPGIFEKADGGPRISGSILFDAYLAWADEENLPLKERWTRRSFWAALEERGATKRNSGKGVVFEGLRRRKPSRTVTPDSDPGERAEDTPLADSFTDSKPAAISGPSLDDAF